MASSILAASSIVGTPQIFRGAAGNPLLAPRGVLLSQNRLVVADTGQNRVFIWNQLPTTEFAEADLVLGQEATQATGRNAGGRASASSLLYPSGLWSDGQRLIVADAWNHRILIWKTFPTKTGQAADVVLGQPDFCSQEPNVQGIGQAPSARSLYWPYGLCSDGEHLWVADTGNRRVLYYDQIPTESFTPADAVIGKSSFTERDYDHQHAIWPYSVKVGPKGQLAVTDTQYYRVLLWQNWQQAFDQPAEALVGQPNFESNGQNQFNWFPAQHTLNWCYDSCFYKDGFLVADTGNSRILWYDQVPAESNTPANDLIGQPNFTTGSENQQTVLSTDQTLYWPFHLQVADRQLVIADTGNHRVVLYQLQI